MASGQANDLLIPTATPETYATPELKSVLVEVSPPLLIVRSFGVDVSFGVSDHISVGPVFSIVNWQSAPMGSFLDNGDIRALEFGVKSTFYLSGTRFQESWIVSSYFERISAKVINISSFLDEVFPKGPPVTGSAMQTGYVLGVVGGYQWVNRSGITFALLAGLADTFSNATTEYFSDGTSLPFASSSKIIPAAQLNVGYAF